MSREKVFISVPAEDEALAAEKIAEVFAEGYIPMEPVLTCDIRGIHHTEQARRKILSECQAIRIYGPVWTEQMWQDIRFAQNNNIPVYTDQEIIPGARPIQLHDNHAPDNHLKGKKHAYER